MIRRFLRRFDGAAILLLLRRGADRKLNTPGLQLIDQFLQINARLIALGGMNRNMPLGIDTEVAFAPVTDVIKIESVLNGPLLHELHRGDSPRSWDIVELFPSCVFPGFRQALVGDKADYLG